MSSFFSGERGDESLCGGLARRVLDCCEVDGDG